MSTLDFANCDVILVDDDLNSRQNLKNILHNKGFRLIRTGRTLAEVREFQSAAIPDLLIGSCDLKDGDFIDYVRDLRQGKLGGNPFQAIVMLVSEPTPELVARIVESGTDTVITKPFSTAQILDRLSDLIASRKRFISADEYVGPARRKDANMPGIEAPNTLKARANRAHINAADLDALVFEATQKLKTLEVDVVGMQIAAHVTNLVPMLERGAKVDPAMRSELLGLLDITDNASETLAGSKYEHVGELCSSLGNVASAILAARGGTPDERDILLLKPLSQAIQACFSGAITDIAQVRAISARIGAS